MKKTILILAALFITPTAFALELAQVAGKYKMTRPGSRISYDLRIDSIGATYITKRSPGGSLDCRGSAMMVRDVLSSALSCDDGTAFEHKIYFHRVPVRSPTFQALVYDGSNGSRLNMQFRRVR
jgi:hypothetical protein